MSEMIERLAKRLREKMEHLDPTDTGELTWEALREPDRAFYRLCVEAVLQDMRKPTEGMGSSLVPELQRAFAGFGPDVKGDVWRAMIDDILSQQTEKA